jgi:Protein of unknown function (DUF3499)
MSRQCARPGCSTTASATLAYDYEQRTSWLVPLSDERHPMAYDLCDVHADTLTVPRGWRLDDRRAADHPRRPPLPPFESAYAFN